eukprot:scaffold869_cov160-Ochromonas_danica.AAC.10
MWNAGCSAAKQVVAMAGHHPLPSRRLWAILLLFSAALSNAFSFSLQHGPSLNRKEVFLRMSSKDMHKQLFKSLTAAAVLSTAFNFASPSLANPTISLEESVQALEKAQQRSDTLSAMASVYEASQEKTLLARARYKYVSTHSPRPLSSEAIAVLITITTVPLLSAL